MQTSLYLARLIGPVFVVVGLSTLVNPQGYLDMATGIIGDAALLYFSCVLGLLGGIALVLAHNVWVADWRVIITVLGWLSVIESAAWILAPRPLARFFGPMITQPTPLIGGAVALILGAVLCYFGYFAAPSTGGEMNAFSVMRQNGRRNELSSSSWPGCSKPVGPGCNQIDRSRHSRLRMPSTPSSPKAWMPATSAGMTNSIQSGRHP